MNTNNCIVFKTILPTVKILVAIWVLNTILYLRITHLSSLWTCRTNGGVAPLHTEIFHNFSLLAVVWDTLGLVSPPTTLFLSQSISGGPRGESHPPATQGDPMRAPKQPAMRPNQQFFLVAKYMASMRHSWPGITTYIPIPVSAYFSWT